MGLIALPGRWAPIPFRGIPQRAFSRQVALTVARVTPVALARTLIEAIQCLPAPLHLAPATFGSAILPFLSNPLSLCVLVRHTRLKVLIAVRKA